MQSLARADTGGNLALGYSAMRGFGWAHPTVIELHLAEAKVMVAHPCGTAFSAGRVKVCQAEVVSKMAEKLELGVAATLGWNDVKAISAATRDLNAAGARTGSPGEKEFLRYHTEGVESSGFCIHFELPHYVTFQSSLDAMCDAKAKSAAVKAREPAQCAQWPTTGAGQRRFETPFSRVFEDPCDAPSKSRRTGRMERTTPWPFRH